ncbi:3-carboxy-cis,cis-muconate cycloisomerase, partial [Streptomyces luteogriseus]
MTAHPGDTGLLAPGWSGSAAASATDDHAFLQALLDAEAALTRAQAATGLAPAGAATAVTAAGGAGPVDVRSRAERARPRGHPPLPPGAARTIARGGP